MKRKRLKKKNIIVIAVILLILVIEFVNPIKLYNKYQLKNLNYLDTSIDFILEKGLKDQILSHDYNKTLDTIVSDKNFDSKNYDIYKELTYYDVKDYTSIVNKLIKKGYNANDINNILKSGNRDDILIFLEKDYLENISDYLKYDFSILNNLDRYLSYKDENNIDNELVVVYVNIGLDKEFYTDTTINNNFSTDMLVNKYIGVSENFVPDNLVTIDSDYAIDSRQKGNKEMVDAFIKMSDDCKKEIGYKLMVRSGYRDYESQESTYNLYLKTYGKKYAESYVTHPGFSEHQTGLAVDIKAESSNTFAGTKESKWLSENAHKYGFILRYESETEEITGIKYESWHYRYVGVDLAKDIIEKDMTYDEYYIRYLNK